MSKSTTRIQICILVILYVACLRHHKNIAKIKFFDEARNNADLQ